MTKVKKPFRVKTKILATDRSQLTGETVSEVIQNKLEYLIDRVENEPPYILWVSKYAFMWSGTSKIFKTLDIDNPLRVPFLTTFEAKGHLPIKRPTNNALQAMEYHYGIALSFPPESLFMLIQTGFKKMEKKINKQKDIAMMACHGYINKEGKLKQPNGFVNHFSDNAISGYFIFCIDEKRIAEVQKQLVDESDIRLQLQFERAKYTQEQILEKRLRTAQSIEQNAIKNSNKLKPYITSLHTNHPVSDWSVLLDKNASEELDQ